MDLKFFAKKGESARKVGISIPFLQNLAHVYAKFCFDVPMLICETYAQTQIVVTCLLHTMYELSRRYEIENHIGVTS